MSLFTKLWSWWKPARSVARTRRRCERTPLGFDVLESRTLLSAPAVVLTALPFVAGSKPQVVVTANDTNVMTEVVIDVAFDGNPNFTGPHDLNETLVNVKLANLKPTTITLNAFPTPDLSSYFVRARVIDAAGNQVTSNVAVMQGPQPNTVNLTVPATVTAQADTASIQVVNGSGNSHSSTVYLYTSLNGAAFQEYAAAPLNKAGAVSIALSGLAAGTYQVQAQIADATGNIDVSAIDNITVNPPTVSITALPLTAGSKPQVVVTASDVNPMTQVAFNVGLDGSSAFSGSDLNQTVATVNLTNNKPVTITLNAFPMPLLTSYYIAATVTDSAGNQGTSSTVIMQGPKPDTVSLTVPKTLTAASDTAVAKVTLSQGNKYPATITLGVDPNGDGVFQKYTSGTVNSSGVANIPITGLPAGSYQIEASFTDPAGNLVVSAPQATTVAATSSNTLPATTTTGTAPAAGGTSTANPPTDTQPMPIVPNVGQVTFPAGMKNPPNVQFMAEDATSSILISPNELDLSAATTNAAGTATELTQSMILVNANADAIGVGQQQLTSVTNLFVNGLSKINVPNYNQVTFVNVYPNIALSYQGSSGNLEYSFTINPGARASTIVLSFPGDTESLDSAGDLILSMPDGSTITETKPVAYETLANGVQQMVTCSYVLNNGQVSFAVGAYSTAAPLVIDPYVFTNFLTAIHPPGSGRGGEQSNLAEDSHGNFYFLSGNDGDDYTGLSGNSTGAGVFPFGTLFNDIAVTKLTPAGVPVYTTYIGGGNDGTINAFGFFNGISFGQSLAVDPAGDVYFSGETFLADATVAPYPTTAGTFTLADFGAALPAVGEVEAPSAL